MAGRLSANFFLMVSPHLIGLRRSESSGAGFTLIELLAVLAIIAFLAVFTLPFVQNALRQAQDAKSLSKLKQLGVLAQMYAGENNGLLVPGKSGPSDVPSMQQWQVLLAPYASSGFALTSGSGIWSVVSDKGPTRKDFAVFWLDRRFPENIVAKSRYWDSGYGINMQPGLPSVTTPNSKESDDQTNPWSRPFRLSEIAKGPQRILFAEWPFWNMYVNAGDLPLVKTYADAQGGRLRAVFFDGHVETLTPENFFAAYRIP